MTETSVALVARAANKKALQATNSRERSRYYLRHARAKSLGLLAGISTGEVVGAFVGAHAGFLLSGLLGLFGLLIGAALAERAWERRLEILRGGPTLNARLALYEDEYDKELDDIRAMQISDQQRQELSFSAFVRLRERKDELLRQLPPATE